MADTRRISILGERSKTAVSTCGTIRKNHSISMISGMDLNKDTYACAKIFRALSLETANKASTVPQAIPHAMATRVTCKVIRAPINRISRESYKAPKSNSNMSVSHQPGQRSEEHTSELQSLMRLSYAVFCLKKKK